MGNAIHSGILKRIPKGTNYVVSVKTGNKTGAGTDANVHIIMINDKGESSKIIELNCQWRNDFEAGKMDDFPIQNLENFGSIQKIELWRDTFGLFDDWYVEWVKVKDLVTEIVHIFPVNRWIPDGLRLVINEHDTILPRNAENIKSRKEEIDGKQKIYEFDQRDEGFFPQLRTLPKDEGFTSSSKWDLRKKKRAASIQIKVKNITGKLWTSPDDILSEYTGSFLRKPADINMWRCDKAFGRQRLSHGNPLVIHRCRSAPLRPKVNDTMLRPLMNGMTIANAIAAKRLYCVDYTIMKDIECTDGRPMVAPSALFFVNKEKDLVPVAIQLDPKPAADNPVFLPSDDEYTWILAKMWFNLADANFHEIVSHLGFTHYLIEPIVVAVHRCLSPSHPVFRLLAPHFVFLFPINHLGLEVLVAQGGWIDSSFQIGKKGMVHLLRLMRKQWRLDIDGKLPRDLEERGVDDASALPFYPYRDDGLLLYKAIYGFVSEIIDGHYKSSKYIMKDREIQEFARILSSPPDAGGAGINGVTGHGQFETTDDIKDVLTSIIFICSAGHTAVNFSHYDDYAFPLNYPTMMLQDPPKDKSSRALADIMSTIPTKRICLERMVITRLLSEKVGKPLGDPEIEYIFDPIGLRALENFRFELKKIGEAIDMRNRERKFPYRTLHPKNVTNVIDT